MEIYEGMLVKDALFYLDKEYSINCLGLTKRKVDEIPSLYNKTLKAKRSLKTFKIDNKTNFKNLEICFSANSSAPIKFVNEFLGIIPKSWTIGQFSLSLSRKPKASEKEKIFTLISLIETAQSFSDIDWIIRFSQKINSPIDVVSKKKLRLVINEQSLILNSEQKENLFNQIYENLKT